MKSLRGSKNIAAYNKRVAVRNTLLLKEELKKCEENRFTFQNIGRLFEYLQRCTGIHRTTLNRNVKYRSLVLEYWSKQPGVLEDIPDDLCSIEQLRAKLRLSDVTISNLKNEVRILNKRIEKMERDELDGQASIGSREHALDVHRDFVSTAMMLVAILERYSDTIAIDFSTGEVLDQAAPPSRRVIVGNGRTRPFMLWLEKNPHVLLGGAKV